MNDIDKWSAKVCGVEIYTAIDDYDNEKPESCWINGRVVKWTIKDPSCREIVRGHFKLTTYYIKLNSGKNWTCQLDKKTYGRGKTIAEAELAAITAIYEASQ